MSHGREGRGLCMAGLSVSRSNDLLKPFHNRLRPAGKPAQIALTAVLRKRIVLMNHPLKNPESALATDTPLLGRMRQSFQN